MQRATLAAMRATAAAAADAIPGSAQGGDSPADAWRNILEAHAGKKSDGSDSSKK
jgi:hypothetical protein